MTHLYELTDAYKALQETEELTDDELRECLENINELFKDKAIKIAKAIRNLQADTDAIDNEIKRLSNRENAIANRIKGLKSYLAQEMELTNNEKIKYELFTISLQKTNPSVQVTDESLIPQDYWRVIPEVREVDKKAILSAFKERQEAVLGTEIITDKKHVVIR